MARRPSRQSARVYLLGYALWTLGMGSVIHPILHEAKESHYCSYILTGWPASMWIAAVMGLIAFPALMAITRVTVDRTSDLPHATMALRLGAAQLVLIIVGAILAVLVGTGTLDHHDPLDLAPFVMAPIMFIVLSAMQSNSDGLSGFIQRSWPGVIIVTILPLIMVGWRIDFNDASVDLGYSAWIRAGSLVLYYVWAAILLIGLATGVISRVMKAGNVITEQLSLVGASMLLVTVPAVLIMVGFLLAHGVYCAD